jgi:hypothetical protein
VNDRLEPSSPSPLARERGRVRVWIADRTCLRTPHPNPLPFTKDICLALSSFPHCHSERSEESLIISLTARQGKSQRCFASLNMTGERDMAQPPNERPNHRRSSK